MTLASPLLSAIPGLHHAFFSRDGGVSGGIYAGLNGGIGSQTIRRMSRKTAAGWPSSWRRSSTFAHRVPVHSPDVVVASRPWDTASRPRANAIVTRTEGLAIGVTAADCGPILLADPKARVIGAAHAGWKGALTGVMEATVEAMEKLGAERGRHGGRDRPPDPPAQSTKSAANSSKGSSRPTRRTRCFSSRRHARATRCSISPASSAMRLENAGVLMIDDIGIDTYSDERFFSYRRSVHREEPDYGRHVHAIVLEA